MPRRTWGSKSFDFHLFCDLNGNKSEPPYWTPGGRVKVSKGRSQQPFNYVATEQDSNEGGKRELNSWLYDRGQLRNPQVQILLGSTKLWKMK